MKEEGEATLGSMEEAETPDNVDNDAVASVSADESGEASSAPQQLLRSDDENAADEEKSTARSCRDLLSTASSWYGRAKEFVPAIAKPTLDTIEAKVGAKLDQYPQTTKRVENFLDDRVLPVAEAAAAKVSATAATVLRSDAGQAVQTRLVAPASAAVAKTVAKTSAIAAAAKQSAGALRTRIDNAYGHLVEGVLDASGHVFDAAAAAVQFERAAASYVKDHWHLPKNPPSATNLHASAVALANFVDEVVDERLPAVAGEQFDSSLDRSNKADPVTPPVQFEASTPDEVAHSGSSNVDVSALARTIAGKVSFRMKKRVVQKLEAAKGNLKMRKNQLLHSTNLIQYAQSMVGEERYAKVSTVLKEAAAVAQTSKDTVVRTLNATAKGAAVSGIELLQRGEATAKLAIVTTGKLSARSQEYARELAAKIRERVKALEKQRHSMSTSSDSQLEATEEAGESALSEAFAHYLADAAATGAATLFVFRGELNQILTYAYAAANGVQSSAAAQISDVGGNLLHAAALSPAWTSLTQFKDTAVEAAHEASTWTNLAFSEFAALGGHHGTRRTLPLGFLAGLRFILDHMAQPWQPATAAAAAQALSHVETDPVSQASEVAMAPEPSVSDSEDESGGWSTEAQSAARRIIFDTSRTSSEEDALFSANSADSGGAVFELDEEQSNAEFYYDFELDDSDDESVGRTDVGARSAGSGTGVDAATEGAVRQNADAVVNQRSGLLKSTSCSDLAEADV